MGLDSGDREVTVRDNSPDVAADEVAGAVAARQALGPDAEEAVIQAFLERTGQAIDARVEQRLAERQSVAPQPLPTSRRAGSDRSPLALAIVSLGVGIPLTGIAAGFHDNQLIAVVVIWAAIALINLVYDRRGR